MRVLVLDGHEPSRLLAQYLLAACGHYVSCAASIEDALGFLCAEQYDVVLADVVPGVPRSAELLARITRTGNAGGATLIAVTSLAMKGDRERILADGFHGYISKPIDPEAFTCEVEHIRDVMRLGSVLKTF